MAQVVGLLLCGCTASAPPEATDDVRRAFHEADQAITEVLFHFDPTHRSEIGSVLRDLARSLDPEIRVTVAIAAESQLAGARAAFGIAGFAEARCRFVSCDGPISIWARDRLIAFARPSGLREFFQPDPGRVDGGVTGDVALVGSLSRSCRGQVLSGWYLEGGNVVVGGGRVFVGYRVVAENPGYPGGVPGIRRRLQELFAAEPVLIGGPEGVPNPHVDMFLTYAGDGRVLLGDPRMGLEALRGMRSRWNPRPLDAPQFEVDEETQQRLIPIYDRVRDQLVAAGLQVVRLPILHSRGDAIYSWNNALVERREDGRRAYVPVYGVEELDSVALDTYRRLGFRTFPIDVSGIMHRGGTVRCLTNVLAWEGPVPPPSPRRTRISQE